MRVHSTGLPGPALDVILDRLERDLPRTFEPLAGVGAGVALNRLQVQQLQWIKQQLQWSRQSQSLRLLCSGCLRRPKLQQLQWSKQAQSLHLL